MRIMELKEARPEVISGALNDLAGGRLNNGGIFTLTAGAASTTISRLGVAAGDLIVISATTANAAAALATTYVPVVTVTKNQFIVQHANNGQTDRTFNFAFFAVLTARAH